MSESIEEHTDVANTIIFWRIYDVLMGIYSNINPEEATQMVKLHESGVFITPPPSYRSEGEQHEQDNL